MKKILSFLLSASVVLTLLFPVSSGYAIETAAEPVPIVTITNGMEISKSAKSNGDGTYTISLEAFATGDKVIVETTQTAPTDIVLVLDQSFTMRSPIGEVSFQQYANSTNASFYDLRHNGGSGNLYYQMSDGSYASVSVVREANVSYTAITKGKNNSDYDNHTNLYENRNNLYAKVGDAYQKVSVNYNSGNSVYTYTRADAMVFTSNGMSTVPNFTGFSDGGILYLASVDDSSAKYSYSYTDADGNTQIIVTSNGADSVPSGIFYQKNVNENAGIDRYEALGNAVDTFVNSVAEKSASGVNHRIAFVGFSNSSKIYVGGSTGNAAQAFQDMSTEAGCNNAAASVAMLKNENNYDGSTMTDDGVSAANSIFQANPINDGRKRVVIVFTDGLPGYNTFSDNVANAAISQGNIAKDTYGATVYTVGIFAGADATSAGDQGGNDTQKGNWFMHTLSSNNGTPQNPSYYLSADNAVSLNNIFQLISDQIETGGTTATLDENAVVKDIVSDAFEIPANSEITVESYQCTGKNGDSYTWSKNADAMGAVATPSGDTVTVKGFDFAGNYVGTTTYNGNVTYHGHKLVISFTVKPKDGFLGGNNVFTNEEAGVYVDEEATTPVMTFGRPQVNVPIKDVTAVAPDKNVYLMGSLSEAELNAGVTPSVANLEDWQKEYVTITPTTPGDLTNLTADSTYTVGITIEPKSNGDGAHGTPAAVKSASATGNIYVYLPEITYQDTSVEYNGNANYHGSSTENRNFVSCSWKHGETSADISTMGAAPELTYSYTVDGETSDGNNLKGETEVQAVVKIDTTNINQYVTFYREACSTCGNVVGEVTGNDPNFIVHMSTFDLTITKSGVADGDSDAAFVFNISGNDIDMNVVIYGNNSVKIAGLPCGEYTVKEVSGYGRYNLAADQTASAENNVVEFVNSIKTSKWLDENDKETNVFNAAPGTNN